MGWLGWVGAHARTVYASVSATLGRSGWSRVGSVKLPKIWFSLFVLFRKQKRCRRDFLLVSRCSILMRFLPTFHSRRCLANLYAGQISR